MDFKTFKEEVKENVRAHLPKEAKDVELSFGTYQKMNYSYEALFINIPEKNAQVSINLDELYEAYKDGQDLSKFYEIIPEIVESKDTKKGCSSCKGRFLLCRLFWFCVHLFRIFSVIVRIGIE